MFNMSTTWRRFWPVRCKNRTFHDALETVGDDFVMCIGRYKLRNTTGEEENKETKERESECVINFHWDVCD